MKSQPPHRNDQHIGERRRCRPDELSEASEDDLAELLEFNRCAPVEVEVYMRYEPLAESLARVFCSQLFHRGADCWGHGAGDGSCVGAYGRARAEILRLILGSDAPGKRKLKALLVKWRGRRHHEQTFSSFARTQLHADDILRAWCSERGLPARCDRVPEDIPMQMLHDLQAEYARLWAGSPMAASIGRLDPERLVARGNSSRTLMQHWLEGMWRDAVQTGDGSLFDSDRLTRWILNTSAPLAEEAELVGSLTSGLDDLLAGQWGEWYDRFLDRGRQLTEPYTDAPE